MASQKFNGYKNWNQWNVSLWINNDEGLYRMTLDCIKQTSRRDDAAECVLQALNDCGVTETPDGAKYSKTAIRAAMVGM